MRRPRTTTTMSFRLTAEERDTIESAAIAEEMTLSEYLKFCALDYARRRQSGRNALKFWQRDRGG